MPAFLFYKTELTRHRQQGFVMVLSAQFVPLFPPGPPRRANCRRLLLHSFSSSLCSFPARGANVTARTTAAATTARDKNWDKLLFFAFSLRVHGSEKKQSIFLTKFCRFFLQRWKAAQSVLRLIGEYLPRGASQQKCKVQKPPNTLKTQNEAGVDAPVC